MKTTYLIYKEINGIRQLVVATPEEWDAILKANKQLPETERRRFELSCVEENGELDRMYIEITAEEHRVWNSKNTVLLRNRKEGAQYVHISLDAPIQAADADSLHDTVASDFDLEGLASDRVLIEELSQALKAWKSWAPELLTIYLNGDRRKCTALLSEKYGVKERTIRYRKERFEEFVTKFLK
ncbi:MAG: hypothetical protein IJF88_06230 [Oscillospiraceae bacterium]|nr:hypothetical protein [Oscillospiraceae bacterium]